MILVSALGHGFHRKQQRKTGMVTSVVLMCPSAAGGNSFWFVTLWGSCSPSGGALQQTVCSLRKLS